MGGVVCALRLFFFLFRKETGDDEEPGGNTDAGVCYVKRGPVVAVGEHGGLNPGEGEIQEVHHVAAHEVCEEAFVFGSGNEESLQQTVGHVADDAGGNECPGDAQSPGGEEAFAEQAVEPHQCHYLNAEEHERCPRGAVAGAKGYAGVVYAYQTEIHEFAALNHRNNLAAEAVLPVVGEVQHNCPFGELVERVEDNDEEDEPEGYAAWHGGVLGYGMTTGALPWVECACPMALNF